MKRLTILFIAAAATLAVSVSQADAVARGAKLKLRHTALGNILVNGQGVTVYAFTRDSRNRDRCVTISGCTGIWPLVTTRGTPMATAGARRQLLSTITLPGGTRQVTYAGHPLYTYIGSAGPGDTSYVGQQQFGGRWLALNAAGHLIN